MVAVLRAGRANLHQLWAVWNGRLGHCEVVWNENIISEGKLRSTCFKANPSIGGSDPDLMLVYYSNICELVVVQVIITIQKVVSLELYCVSYKNFIQTF